jgi:photosynthetic reaction center cytochrome c subunit
MRSMIKFATVALTLAAGFLVSGCERPPAKSEQVGYRGVGMVQVDNKRTLAKLDAANQMPELIAKVKPNGPLASKAYQNVQVLGDLTEDEFTRTMLAITEWVSPDDGTPGQGCAYCHNLNNLAEDSVYTKVVARRMFQMTKHINQDWTSHVGQTGVTCYTCHRGKNVPAEIWFSQPEKTREKGVMGNNNGQNQASKSVAFSSLPYDPFTSLLQGTANSNNIRVAGPTALPSGAGKPTQDAEKTYGLMMHMSSSLGVNCTYCHNTRSFQSWENANPTRVNAWHGLNMVRALNNDYLNPLLATYPEKRLGPTGDAPKTYCATCHQGAAKPLNGAQMLKDYLELNVVKLTK